MLSGCDDTTRESQFHCIIAALKNQHSGYFYAQNQTKEMIQCQEQNESAELTAGF